MWSAEHSIETSAPPEAVWRLWSDVPRWPEWNADLERAELSGEFAPGSAITMYLGTGIRSSFGSQTSRSPICSRPGDVVRVPGGEWHWHGAAPDHFMTHLSMAEGEAEWGEHVTESEYEGQE
jgi:hypothetical protein